MVIDGIFVMATNAIIQPSVWTPMVRYQSSSTIGLSNKRILAIYKAILFRDPDSYTPAVGNDAIFWQKCLWLAVTSAHAHFRVKGLII